METREEVDSAVREPGFEVRLRTDIGPVAHEVVPYVDGIELVTLVGEYERSRGMDAAGQYGGIILEHFDFGDLDGYFTGRPTSSYWLKLGRIALLGCDCGEVGCWPLYATVDAARSRIRWSGFSQPFRPARDYGGFGPYVFDAVRYRNALSNALTVLPPGLRGGR